jgi:hypothetical protein
VIKRFGENKKKKRVYWSLKTLKVILFYYIIWIILNIVKKR